MGDCIVAADGRSMQCAGCLHAAKVVESVDCQSITDYFKCENKKRIARLVAEAKEQIGRGNYFTAGQMLTNAGQMQLDFNRSGYTKCSSKSNPPCYTYIISDEDFNDEANWKNDI